MKSKAVIGAALLAVVLAGCRGSADLSLADAMEPDKAIELGKSLSPEDQKALAEYEVIHKAQGDLDPNMTVAQAIKARQAEIAKAATAKKHAASIQ